MTCKTDGCWGECGEHEPAASWDYPVLSYDGDLSYEVIEKNYWKATSDAGLEPNLMIVSPNTFAKIKSMFQTQAKFVDTKPTGFLGMKYNGATIVTDPYVPDGELILEFPE